MAILKPNEVVTEDNIKIKMIIAGHPGIGKTTLALSAPKPLLIDTDRGVHRVNAKHRKDCIIPATYQDLLDDLRDSDLKEYDTLVIDTGGELLNLMKAHVIAQDKKNAKRDGSLSLQGYGAVGAEFSRFTGFCYYKLNKHVVIVFHAKEEKDGDNTTLRILVEGQTKNAVWQPMDLGGFIEIQGENRVLSMENSEKHFGKVTYGISPVLSIPILKDSVPNNFLTKLFKQASDNIRADMAAFEMEKSAYEALVTEYSNDIETIETVEDVNVMIDALNNVEHVLTSERELKNMLKKKAESLGLKWDRGNGKYVPTNSKSA